MRKIQFRSSLKGGGCHKKYVSWLPKLIFMAENVWLKVIGFVDSKFRDLLKLKKYEFLQFRPYNLIFDAGKKSTQNKLD